MALSFLQVSAKENDIDDILRNKNVPDEVIETMPESLKEDIAKNAGVFESFAKGSSLTRTIPSSEMDLYINVYSNPNGSDGKKRKLIYIYYNWKNPSSDLTWRLNDPFGVAWEDDWRPVNNSWYHVDEVRYTDGTANFREDSDLSECSDWGVGWDADLFGYNPYKTEKSMGGYGKVIMEEKNLGTATSDVVYGKYGHSIGVSGGINIGGPLSISLTGINGSCKRACMADFDL